jgi:hypothetical protein
MKRAMTLCAQRDQVVVSVLARSASELSVMYFKVFKTSAVLAPPLITAQDFQAKTGIQILVKPYNGTFWLERAHEVIWFAVARNRRFCSSRRNLKKVVMDCTRISGLLLSSCAPARKSAQIISRQ